MLMHRYDSHIVVELFELELFVGDWAEWTPCDGECGGGVRTRERDDPCIPDFVPELETEECVPISKLIDERDVNPKVLRAKVNATKSLIASLLDKYKW